MNSHKKSLIAVIREAECIGCMKCIQACPFDAILGANQLMHTVIVDECIGCKLCIDPCPVDCIDLIPTIFEDKQIRIQKAQHAKKRYHARNLRLENKCEPVVISTNLDDKKNYIQAALLRVQAKKSLHKN